MAQDVTDFDVGKSIIQGPLERVGHENRDLFGPSNGNERSECLLIPKKYKRHIKYRHIGNLMYMSFAADV